LQKAVFVFADLGGKALPGWSSTLPIAVKHGDLQSLFNPMYINID